MGGAIPTIPHFETQNHVTLEQNPIDLPWTSHEFPIKSLRKSPQKSPDPSPLSPRPAEATEAFAKATDVVMFPRFLGEDFCWDLFRPTKWARCPKHISIYIYIILYYIILYIIYIIYIIYILYVFSGFFLWEDVWMAHERYELPAGLKMIFEVFHGMRKVRATGTDWDWKNCQTGWFWPEVTIL